MPPRRGRRGRGTAIGGGRGRTKASSGIRLRSSKEKLDPLEPQPGYAFLSLPVPTLTSQVAEKEWPLLSNRASVYLLRDPADETAQYFKQEQLVASAEDSQHQGVRKPRVSKPIINENAAFLTLKIGISAWERSQIPLAQTWRATRTSGANLNYEQEVQTTNLTQATSPRKSCGLSLSSSLDALTSKQQPFRKELRSALITAAHGAGGLVQGSPNAPDFSPITPVFSSDYAPIGVVSSAPFDIHSSQFAVSHSYQSSPYDMSNKSNIDAGGVDDTIKDVIQNLFVMQQHVASFRPEHQEGLNRKVEDIAVSLQKLDDLVTDPSNPIHNIKIAPDIIDYVDDGRNPDIYTRDFVELVQRGNAVLNGKQRAFRNFSKIYAKALKDNFDGMGEEVDLIMDNAGMEERNGKFVEKQQNGTSA